MANQTKGIVLAAVMILSVLATGVGTVSAAGDTEVSVTPANPSVDVGDQQTFDIIVESGSDGSQGYNVTVELTNGTVANITSADTEGSPGLEDSTNISSDGNSVTIVGGYLNPLPGDTPLKIATVTVEGATAGSTDVEISSNSEIRDDSNNRYTITGYNSATMTVTDQSPDFQVSNLDVPDSVMQGDTVTATATITNEGSAQGTETVEFSINGTVLDSTSLTLAAGAAQNVSLTADTSSLRSGDLPAEVTAGSSSSATQLTVADTDVSLNPSSSTTSVGDQQTFDIVIEDGSDGSQGYNVTASLANGTVAEITDADTAGSPGLEDAVQINSANDSVTITAGYFNALNGSQPLTIATVTVEGTAQGSTDLELDSSSEIRDGNNRRYVVGEFNSASVSVISSGPAFEVTNLKAPSSVTQGDAAIVGATVTNVGTANGTETVEFSINGTVLASQSVTLAPGDSEFVNLTANTGSLQAGQYTAAMSAGSSTVTAPLTIADTDVSITPVSASSSVGGTQTFEVVLENGSRGTQGYNVTLTLSNASIGQITAANTTGSPGLADNVQINSNGDVVNIEAGYINPVSGAQPLTIATVTVEGNASGTAELQVDSGAEIRDGNNDRYVLGDLGSAQMLVGIGVTVPGATGPAQSIDSDPLLEDVDGDGSADVFDAITLYNNLNAPEVQNNPRFFDFDGNGNVEVFDAISLYNELQTLP